MGFFVFIYFCTFIRLVAMKQILPWEHLKLKKYFLSKKPYGFFQKIFFL